MSTHGPGECIWSEDAHLVGHGVLRVLDGRARRCHADERVYGGVDVPGVDVGVDNEIEELAHGQRGHASLSEEVVDVQRILSQKVQRTRMIQVNRLAHIDDPQLTL